MKKRKKNKSQYSPNPLILKEAARKGNLQKGLKALGSIWKRGLIYRDLETSFFFSWLAYANWNVVQMAKLTGIHRNTAIQIFKNKFRIKSTLKIRIMWIKIMGKRFSFPDKVKLLYDQVGMKPRFSKEENRGLVNLWLMGIPRKVVRAYNVLYLLRNGFTLDSVQKRLGKGYREIQRYRVYAVQAGSPALKWLAPVKATKKDWFPRKHIRVSNSKEGIRAEIKQHLKRAKALKEELRRRK